MTGGCTHPLWAGASRPQDHLRLQEHLQIRSGHKLPAGADLIGKIVAMVTPYQCDINARKVQLCSVATMADVW